jgi:hypothetical protein
MYHSILSVGLRERNLSTAWHEGSGTFHKGFCMFGALASVERGETTISFDFDIPYLLISESS